MPRGSTPGRQQFKMEMRAAWEAVDQSFEPELVFGKHLGVKCGRSNAVNFHLFRVAVAYNLALGCGFVARL